MIEKVYIKGFVYGRRNSKKFVSDIGKIDIFELIGNELHYIGNIKTEYYLRPSEIFDFLIKKKYLSNDFLKKINKSVKAYTPCPVDEGKYNAGATDYIDIQILV